MIPTTRCATCRLITSEFVLSADFPDCDPENTARDRPLERVISHHSFSVLEESASRGCDLCLLIRQHIFRYSSEHAKAFPAPEDILRLCSKEPRCKLELTWANWAYWGGNSLRFVEVNEEHTGAARSPSLRPLKRASLPYWLFDQYCTTFTHMLFRFYPRNQS